MADQKLYYSWRQIHECVEKTVSACKEFNPDLIIAIGGGGYIPARILRTYVKVNILTISLELYNELNKTNNQVKKKMWFDETIGLGNQVNNSRILIVDEIYDTGRTLHYAVDEISRRYNPSAIATVVLHNKNKPKSGTMPEDVELIVGETIEDKWVCYPWDAYEHNMTIEQHEKMANLKS
jgi:hypoxanthine phosphoribosyltransferase